MGPVLFIVYPTNDQAKYFCFEFKTLLFQNSHTKRTFSKSAIYLKEFITSSSKYSNLHSDRLTFWIKTVWMKID